jgi:hypothetical protein
MSFDIGRQTEQTFQFWSLTQGRLFGCKGSSLCGEIQFGFLANLIIQI